jgi:hypothetical protein
MADNSLFDEQLLTARRTTSALVKRVISTVRRPLPIYPNEQTFSVSVGMSQRLPTNGHGTHFVDYLVGASKY